MHALDLSLLGDVYGFLKVNILFGVVFKLQVNASNIVVTDSFLI